MAAADPLTDEYVLAWLQTGPGAQDKGIFARAEELREALLKHGYGSLAGLRVLTEDELKQVKVGTKTIPAGIRALLMADLQGRWTLQPTAQRRVRFGEREKRPREQWVGGPKFPAATASGFPEVEQMQAYIKRLITFADAHDAGVADAVDKLRRAVCDEGRTLTPEEVEEALLGSGEGADRQLAAVVEAAMPDVTMNLIVDKIGIRKGANYAPSYAPIYARFTLAYACTPGRLYTANGPQWHRKSAAYRCTHLSRSMFNLTLTRRWYYTVYGA